MNKEKFTNKYNSLIKLDPDFKNKIYSVYLKVAKYFNNFLKMLFYCFLNHLKVP